MQHLWVDVSGQVLFVRMFYFNYSKTSLHITQSEVIGQELAPKYCSEALHQKRDLLNIGQKWKCGFAVSVLLELLQVCSGAPCGMFGDAYPVQHSTPQSLTLM